MVNLSGFCLTDWSSSLARRNGGCPSLSEKNFFQLKMLPDDTLCTRTHFKIKPWPINVLGHNFDCLYTRILLIGYVELTVVVVHQVASSFRMMIVTS